MTDMLSIGASSLRAYQGALGTVSENIANVATPGYARRTAGVAEVTGPGGGTGVHTSGIVRAGDPYRASDVRRAGSDLARTATGVDWLDRIEAALGGNQLAQRLTGFFTSATAVAGDPSAAAPREAMLAAAGGVADAFAATGATLDRLVTDLDTTARAAAASLNGFAAGLARINGAIGRTTAGTAAAAGLSDQRDTLLEAMSALADVAVSLDDFGRATVRMSGPTGPILIAGDEAGGVVYTRDANGAVAFSLHRAGERHAVTPTGGALAGIADAASRLVDTRQLLGGIATDFVSQVNAVQAQGRDLDGNPGAALFAPGTPATALGVALADARGIAAAAVGGGVRDNANLAALSALRASGNYEGRVTALAGDNAAALAARRTVAAAQTAIHEGAVAGRDAITAVDLDSEAVDLLRFQQAYQASTRVIQIARETLQSILDIR